MQIQTILAFPNDYCISSISEPDKEDNADQICATLLMLLGRLQSSWAW